ncbi:CxxxxCH/CxxCH domain-containing protein [Schaalia sp. Marseille-Q2122]
MRCQAPECHGRGRKGNLPPPAITVPKWLDR